MEGDTNVWGWVGLDSETLVPEPEAPSLGLGSQGLEKLRTPMNWDDPMLAGNATGGDWFRGSVDFLTVY